MTRTFEACRATAQDLGSLLSIAQAGVLLELPGVKRELVRLRSRLRTRLDSGHGELPDELRVVYQGALTHITDLLEGERGEPGATQQTILRARGDWLAAQRRAGRLQGEEAEAVDHLFALWHEIRKSLQEATVPLERLFRQRTRKVALLPLERLPDEQGRAAMDLWLPWARRWRSRPAAGGNQKQQVNSLQVVEQLVMQGRDPARVEANYGLQQGDAVKLLREALADYAKHLQMFLDKQQGF